MEVFFEDCSVDLCDASPRSVQENDDDGMDDAKAFAHAGHNEQYTWFVHTSC